MFSILGTFLLALPASATIFYAGVAESGGEFGVWSGTGEIVGLPGTFGKEYAFIDESTVDIFVDEQKINLFRVAFLLERLCPLESGLGAVFNETVSCSNSFRDKSVTEQDYSTMTTSRRL
jgi:endoglucanase